MFIVIELQVNADGTVGNIVTSHATLPEAQNKFYSVCAFAAISEIPTHSVVILDRTGVMIERCSFEHVVSQPETSTEE